jgi:hypothetical protein
MSGPFCAPNLACHMVFKACLHGINNKSFQTNIQTRAFYFLEPSIFCMHGTAKCPVPIHSFPIHNSSTSTGTLVSFQCFMLMRCFHIRIKLFMRCFHIWIKIDYNNTSKNNTVNRILLFEFRYSMRCVYSYTCSWIIARFSLTSLLSRVCGQQVFLDKFTFSCVQSTSFP